jgi:hypothetical protein
MHFDLLRKRTETVKTKTKKGATNVTDCSVVAETGEKCTGNFMSWRLGWAENAARMTERDFPCQWGGGCCGHGDERPHNGGRRGGGGITSSATVISTITPVLKFGAVLRSV